MLEFVLNDAPQQFLIILVGFILLLCGLTRSWAALKALLICSVVMGVGVGVILSRVSDGWGVLAYVLFLGAACLGLFVVVFIGSAYRSRERKFSVRHAVLLGGVGLGCLLLGLYAASYPALVQERLMRHARAGRVEAFATLFAAQPHRYYSPLWEYVVSLPPSPEQLAIMDIMQQDQSLYRVALAPRVLLGYPPSSARTELMRRSAADQCSSRQETTFNMEEYLAFQEQGDEASAAAMEACLRYKLTQVVHHGDHALLKRLLEQGADPNAQLYQWYGGARWYPLEEAHAREDDVAINLLLEYGAHYGYLDEEE